MSRLNTIDWYATSVRLQQQINRLPVICRRDATKMWNQLYAIAQLISQLEVVERQRQRPNAIKGNELVQALQAGIQNLEHMILLAHLQNG